MKRRRPRNAMKKELQLPSEISQVQTASAEVLRFLKPVSLSDDKLFDIRLCLEEALINAIKYGNKLDKNTKVYLSVEYDREAVRIVVEDKGQGFNPKSIRSCISDENLLNNCGRGVYLIHRLMDEVNYNDKGNRVSMVKFVKNGSA